MTKREIVAKLAREKVVETMLGHIARQPVTGDLQDLAQEVYCTLLGYEEEKVVALYEGARLNFFIARILTNQFRSRTSTFHYTYRVPELRSREVNENDATSDK